MATVTIPLTTLTVGSHDFGPAPIADADSKIILTIDRTVANGLNAQPATTQIKMTSFQSNDGGATWNELASGTIEGGVFTKGGVTATQDILTVNLWPGTSRQVKANVTVSGASVAVQGTVATQ